MQWDTMSDRDRDALVAEHIFDMARYVEPPVTETPEWMKGVTPLFTIDLSGGEPNPSWVTRDGKRLYTSPVWPILARDAIPPYTTDHNAAAEVRAEIARRRLHGDFLGHLGSILEVAIPVAKGIGLKSLWELTNATPEQQCRAALRAVGVEV